MDIAIPTHYTTMSTEYGTMSSALNAMSTVLDSGSIESPAFQPPLQLGALLGILQWHL